MEELKSIGSLAQLGAFGVLVYIVYWTLKNVPRWMEDNRKLRETEMLARETVAQAHRDSVARVAQAHQQSMRELIDRHDTHINRDREECERRHRELLLATEQRHKEQMEAHAEEMERLRILDHTLRDVAQSRASQDHLRRTKSSPKNNTEADT